jgi:hypothetical protein
MAVLDTGSSTTLIEKQFCEDNGLDVHRVQGHIQLGQKGVTVPQVGVTKILHLSTVDLLHEATGRLEVMSMPSRHVVVVGRDFMAQLGIRLYGLPTCIEGMSAALADIVEDDRGVTTVFSDHVSVMSPGLETQMLPFSDVFVCSAQTGSILEFIFGSRCDDPVLFEYGDSADNCTLLDLHL